MSCPCYLGGEANTNPTAIQVALHSSSGISREVSQGQMTQVSCAAPVSLRAKGSKLQPEHGYHTLCDQELDKLVWWKSEIPTCLKTVSLILDTPDHLRPLMKQMKEASAQRGQCFSEGTISTAATSGCSSSHAHPQDAEKTEWKRTGTS